MSKVQRGPVVTTPAPFQISRSNAGKMCDISLRKGVLGQQESGGYAMDEALAVFASLLGPQTGPYSASDSPKFLQSIDLSAPYQNVVVPFFGQLFDSQMMNARANFLSQSLCPIWQTSDMNFSVNRTEFNNVMFTPISELGVPDEQTHFTYGWTDSVEKCALNARVSRDLALDERFGEAAWLAELAGFAANALLTINVTIAYSLINIGYRNQTENRANEIVMDHMRLFMAEWREFLAFALDAERGMQDIRNYEELIPNMDTVVGPAGFARYLRDIEGASYPIPAIKPVANPDADGLMLEFYRGPDSYKSVKLGDRLLHFLEMPAIAINTISKIRYQPLTRRVTIGQFHPPNPRISAATVVHSSDPDQHDITINYMTQTRSEDGQIALRTRLEGCNYWDKRTGAPSQMVQLYADALNESKNETNRPWTWNHENKVDRDTAADINNDHDDYNTPVGYEVAGKRNPHEMKSWRTHFCGTAYDPASDEYYVPQSVMQWNLSQIPNWVLLQAAEHLALKTRERTGHDSLDTVFFQIDKFLQTLQDARWSDAFVRGVIDKNLPRMIKRNPDATTSEYIIEPEQTPERSLANYPGAHRIDEFACNPDGCLDLPDKDSSILLEGDVPPGYRSGPGIITLAREANKPSSLWRDIGRQAQQVVDIFNGVMQTANDHIGKTEATNARLTYPWFHRESSLAVLIDTYIGVEGPVFLGVPPSASVYSESRGASSTSVGGTGAVVVGLSLVTNEERTRAILRFTEPNDVTDFNAQFVAPSVDPERNALNKELLTVVFSTANYTASPIDQKRLNMASVIAYGALKAVTEPSGMTAEEQNAALRTYLANVKGSNRANLKKFMSGLEQQYGDRATGKPLNNDEIESLKREQGKSPLGVTPKSRDQAPTREDRIRDATLSVPPTYVGDFDRAPTRYLRAPLVISPNLYDYLATSTGPAYVLPGDETLFYEAPESIGEVRQTSVANEKDTTATTSTTSIRFAGMRPMLARLTRNQRDSATTPTRQGVGQIGMQLDGDDLFASLSQPQKSKKGVASGFSVSGLLQMGAGPYERAAKPTPERFTTRTVRTDDDDETEKELHQTFHRGPQRERLRFIDEEIQAPAARFFFRLLLEAPNHRDTFVRLASAGAGLFEVIVVRAWIQAYTNALILMEAGPNTCLYAFGHSTINVSKEHRGLYHLGCGFYHGMVRTNPDNVQLFFNATPAGFIGGKKLDFVKSAEDWARPNPTKPSCMGFLVPWSERWFGGQAHLMNDETYAAPNDEYSVPERKCSAFGSWYAFEYRKNRPEKIDAQHKNRMNYRNCPQMTHALGLGPTKYIDPQSLKQFSIEGVGPAGEWRMNMPGSNLTWMGQATLFPGRLENALINQ